jgi:hypothetical protein
MHINDSSQTCAHGTLRVDLPNASLHMSCPSSSSMTLATPAPPPAAPALPPALTIALAGGRTDATDAARVGAAVLRGESAVDDADESALGVLSGTAIAPGGLRPLAAAAIDLLSMCVSSAVVSQHDCTYARAASRCASVIPAPTDGWRCMAAAPSAAVAPVSATRSHMTRDTYAPPLLTVGTFSSR